ncbi:MAG: undecaprenyl/decaprenyl-phosphate alpha-N-acetylglucosaminyl 1-phosphate transferase [Muribaculaceae bacterium]|nr:undecaprenyl/decaprenyl-phosphate alpha-N-acetylglucosaminyl 1-phosphate transferase [Muribaculaceae bacterium]
MAFWIENYFLCLIVSVVLAGIIIPNVITIAFKRKLFDDIDERKIHRGAVPRLGGISFMPAFIFSFFLIIGCDIRLDVDGQHEVLESAMVAVRFLLCSLMLMYLVGIADDLIGVRYRGKFILQIIAGILLVFSGCWIKDFYGFVGIDALPDIAGWIVSVFLVIYVVNAINLIDGIDGLASGLSAVALIFYSCIFFRAGQYADALLAGATLGTLLPFFYYNVFGSAEKHTKIFMGDTGSLTIGTVLAFLSIRIFNLPEGSDLSDGNTFVIAIAPIIVPCFDVARVFLHRVRNGHNPFLPDKCHIHHKLLALGCRQWEALITILAADVLFILLNLALSPYLSPTWVIVGDMVLWVLLNILITQLIRGRERVQGVRLYE